MVKITFRNGSFYLNGKMIKTVKIDVPVGVWIQKQKSIKPKKLK